MKVISLKCNNCSADLKIPENTKFFNCTFCHSTLAIQHFGNTVFTKVSADLRQHNQQLLDNSESLLLEKQISRLDRDWEATAKSLSIRIYRSGPIAPALNQLLVVFFGLVFIGFSYQVSQSFFLPIGGLRNTFSPVPFSPANFISFGLVLASLYLLWMAYNIFQKATKYKEAKARYEKQRQRLLQQLEKASKH